MYLGHFDPLLVAGLLYFVPAFQYFGRSHLGQALGDQIVAGIAVGDPLDFSGMGVISYILKKYNLHD